MKSIEENIKNEIIINKSKFITLLIRVNTIDEVNKCLNDIKTEYKGATHYCYSYIIDNVKRFNDDGEPSGTAGMPILNVLENNNLNYILCIVVRYFGGIKLGAGGLVRAYTKSVTSCLDKVKIKDLKEYYRIKINFKYELNKTIDNILKEYNIINKSYDEIINYELYIETNDLNIEVLSNLCELEIIDKLYL